MAGVLAVNVIPDPQPSPNLMRTLEEEDSMSTPKMTTDEHQKKLLETLEDNRGLDGLQN